MKKNELYDLARSMYTEQFITEAEIARRLNISDRTVRRWKSDGKWGQRRIKGLDKETFSNEDIKTIARKMLNDFNSDIDNKHNIDSSRMSMFINLLDEMIKNKKTDISMKELKEISLQHKSIEDEIKEEIEQFFNDY